MSPMMTGQGLTVAEILGQNVGTMSLGKAAFMKPLMGPTMDHDVYAAA